jgi:protein phosphatase
MGRAWGIQPVTGFDQIEHASASDVGVRRSHNQDAHAVLLATDAEHWQQLGHVFLVADGMGGHAVGELAAEMSVGIIPHTYHKYAREGADAALRKAFLEANASIRARGQQNREFEGMGTTTTALVLRPEGAWVGHVGDSRAYRIRDGTIEQLTFDHSWVWELAKRKGVPPEAMQHIPSNRIMRSLGTEPLVEVDVEGPHPLRDDDIFVLCSDGLSGQVSDHEIGAVATVLPPAEACQFLVNLANLRGGPDNITVMIVHVGRTGADAGVPAAAAGPPKPWYLWLPWWLSTLLVGVVFAAGAVEMSVLGLRGAAGYLFVLAAAVLFTGLGGLAWQTSNRTPAADPSPRRRLMVHRRTPCRIERPMVANLAKALANLQQQLRDRNWEVDWDRCQEHQRAAEQLVKRNELPAAFREYCLAMRHLTDVIQRMRHKEEVFQPLWDKITD